MISTKKMESKKLKLKKLKRKVFSVENQTADALTAIIENTERIKRLEETFQQSIVDAYQQEVYIKYFETFKNLLNATKMFLI